MYHVEDNMDNKPSIINLIENNKKSEQNLQNIDKKENVRRQQILQ